jgi:sec-independent protein translocase protein TatA
MGSLSLVHWLLVIGVVLLLFGGRGKISELMGDFAQGIKSFKKGLSDDEAKPDATEPPGKIIDHQPASTVAGDLKQRADTERRVEGSMT